MLHVQSECVPSLFDVIAREGAFFLACYNNLHLGKIGCARRVINYAARGKCIKSCAAHVNAYRGCVGGKSSWPAAETKRHLKKISQVLLIRQFRIHHIS